MDRFDLLDEIGSGPLGRVLRARERTTGRMVALRLIDEPDPARAAALLATARRAASIRDPRVVEVLSCGIDSDRVWVAMELVEGRTLAQVLADEGRFDPARLVDVGCALCAALEAGHRGDLVHRDLKPKSVMLLPGGGVKVMDFGLAHARDRVGTAPYVSPEAERGWRVDPRSDLYSLGVLLIELANGEAHRDVDDVIALPAEVPAALRAVLLRLIHKDAAARFRSAAAAAEALRGCVEGARPAGRLKPRHRRALLGATLALVGVVGVVMWSRGRALAGIAPAFLAGGCEIVLP
jgi:serine/threonine protein kinase